MNKILQTAAAALVFTSVNAAATEVIPSGECVGVKLYTDGLIVTDTAEVTDTDGRTRNIAKEYDIRDGDIITTVNGRHAVSNELLINELQSGGSVNLTVERDGGTRTIDITPAATEDGQRLGLWLRDSTAGLGTITCYYNDSFAALGHGIYDIDTGNIMPVGRGIIQGCTVNSVRKGEAGAPGALTGAIDGEFLGSVTENTENGLFGKSAAHPAGSPMEVAEKSEVRCGAATILADVDGGGVREYSVEIKKLYPSGGEHDMVVRVTDAALLEKTGGIVQGMSGAPIIQNNKLVGAITHVFVKDSASGYGILAEHLLEGI